MFLKSFSIHISFPFKNGPWGGGNQFLKALREYFRKAGVYSESSKKADVILFNSHHNFDEVFNIKKKYPNKILIHRVDGLVWKFNALPLGLLLLLIFGLYPFSLFCFKVFDSEERDLVWRLIRITR